MKNPFHALVVFAIISLMMLSSAQETNETLDESGGKQYQIVSTSTFTTTTTVSTSTSMSTSTTSTSTTQTLYPKALRYPDKREDINNPYANITRGSAESSECGIQSLCLVEYSTSMSGNPDCCNEQNNEVCGLCLENCKIECSKRTWGVKSCFMNGDIPVCQCSDKEPTCYEPIKFTTITSPPNDDPNPQNESSPTIAYLLAAGFIMLVLALSIEFIFRSDKE